MSDQRTALLRLLDDDDPHTLTLLKAQLVAGGVAALPQLREMLQTAGEPANTHLRDVLARIESQEADAIFANCCAHFRQDGNLEEASWLLASTFMPGESFQSQRDLLQIWGAEVTRRLGKASTDRDRIETLVEYLGHELRFRGNLEDYYNIHNSLLPEVIETRMGIPISLSLVYMLVGQRAGLNVHGVGLPGHFIIRYGEDFFDPFHAGARLGLDECWSLFEQQGQTLTAELLEPATPLQILRRILTNLYHIAAPSDPELATKLASWMEALGRPLGSR